jgi:hypothetical protein
MPPRFAYWTILIDHKPTAFRARDRHELVPTFNQLKRANTDIEIKWFARGRVWDSPADAARERLSKGRRRTPVRGRTRSPRK